MKSLGGDLFLGQTVEQLPNEHSTYDLEEMAYDASFLQDSAVRDLSFST